MRDIVPDERRRDGPKAARREAVARSGPLDSVASLAGATSPCCTRLLASGPLRAITASQPHVTWL
jgi:hypothetical protein